MKEENHNKKGNRKFDLKYRPLKSNSTLESFGPGFKYKIDATMADVYLVSPFDNESVIGRPILYLVVDVFSRLIVGFYVGLEGPSWNGVLSTIYNCTEDKVELCEKYGIAISCEEWPSTGLPEVILVDRGEFSGPMVDDVVGMLGISHENTPSYGGDSKGIVERKFRTINDNLKQGTPEVAKKGVGDNKLDAILNINDFTKLMIYSILERNKSLLIDYPLNKEMIDDKVCPKPIEIWNWGMKNKPGYLHNVSEELLKVCLLRNNRKGIKFKNYIL